MTYEQLKMFVAVADEGSFRAAAKAVFKTQSTVSAAIKALEDELDLLLFSRQGYRPALTAEGQVFYRRAKIALGHMDNLSDLAAMLSAQVESAFTIAFSAMCPLARVLCRMTSVVKSFPHTDFRIMTEVLGGIIERLDSGAADVAIRPGLRVETRYEACRLPLRTTMITVAAPGYFGTDPGQPISQDEVRRYTQIVVRDTAEKRVMPAQDVIDGGRLWQVNDLETKKALALAGLGWGRLPQHRIETELDSGELEAVHIRGIEPTVTLPLLMLRRRGQAVGPVGQALWDRFSVPTACA